MGANPFAETGLMLCPRACAGPLPVDMTAAELWARIDLALERAADDKSPANLAALRHLLELADAGDIGGHA